MIGATTNAETENQGQKTTFKAEKRNPETTENVVHHAEKVVSDQDAKAEMVVSGEVTINQGSQEMATPVVTGLQDAIMAIDHPDVKAAAVSLASAKAETENRSLADHLVMANVEVDLVNAEVVSVNQEASVQTDLHLVTENQDHQETKRVFNGLWLAGLTLPAIIHFG